MGGYAKVASPLLRRLLAHPAAALASHWTFQGLLYMDPTERAFKLALDAALTAAGWLLVRIRLPHTTAWTLAFLLAHTLNFLLNGHYWGVLKHFDATFQESIGFNDYTQLLVVRARAEPSIKSIVICGSLARQQWRPGSDLDARFIRRAGLSNGLRGASFLLRERTAAFFKRIPVDFYLLDGSASLSKLRPGEYVVLDLHPEQSC